MPLEIGKLACLALVGRTLSILVRVAQPPLFETQIVDQTRAPHRPPEPDLLLRFRVKFKTKGLEDEHSRSISAPHIRFIP